MFSKNPNQVALKNFKDSWSASQSTWLALQMNQTHFRESFESYMLEAHYQYQGKTKISQINWGEGTSQLEIDTVLNSKKNISGSVSFKEHDFIQSIHHTLEELIHDFFKRARDLLVTSGTTPVQAGGLNPQEGQGIEWLRVTLEVLKKALEDVKAKRKAGGPEVSQGLFFCGVHPNSSKFTFRLRIFNLDIEAQEDENNALRVVVFDKKNQDSFKGLEPVLKMVFNREKQLAIDYLIQTLPNLSPTIVPLTK